MPRKSVPTGKPRMGETPAGIQESYDLVYEDMPMPDIAQPGQVRLFWEEKMAEFRDSPHEQVRIMVSSSKESVSQRRSYLSQIYGKEFKFGIRQLPGNLWGLWAIKKPEESNGHKR